MNQKIFKIKRAFLMPFSILVLLLFVLLMISFIKGQAWERILLAVFFLGTLAAVLEANRREIMITDDGLTLKKFFRSKDFSWNEITHLAVVNLGKKAYFLLTTTKGFYFFSNLYENHALLVHSLVDKLDIEKVEVEVRDYLEHPVERVSNIVLTWLAAGVVFILIVLKFVAA